MLTNVTSPIKRVIESLFFIYNKEGIKVPFILNNIQSKIDDELNKGVKRLSILKFRQGGVSSYIMARMLIKCMIQHSIAVMIAHDKDHTAKLLQRAQQMLNNLRGNLKPKFSRFNENEIIFEKTESSFYIGTAGSKNFGRSATITDLHLSEIAFYPDPKTLLTGVLQAVPMSGVVIQETTGNGYGTWFQQEFYRYLSGKGLFKPLFLPWFEFNEYKLPYPAEPPFDDEELELMNNHNVDLYQIAWRRAKLEELGGDLVLFKQEYPSKIEDAFRLTGRSIFRNIELSVSEDWIVENKEFSYLHPHPLPSYHYVLGVDPSGGTGNDFSSISIGCLETNELVGVWSSNTIEPPDFAFKVIELGKRYNEAFIVPEVNSHGITIVNILKSHYDPSKIYKRVMTKGVSSKIINMPGYSYGWLTNDTSKSFMVGLTQQILKEGFKIYSPVVFDELNSFGETAEGKLKGLGEHDDHAISFMLMCVGIVKMRSFYPELVFNQYDHVAVQRCNDVGREVKEPLRNKLIKFNDLFEDKKWKRTHCYG